MTIAIIPARGGSKGIPNKNLKNIGGVNLISRTINAAMNCSHISQVFVTTDCEQIASVSVSAGANLISRPSHLASDTASSEDALIHAISSISGFELISPKFVFLQCTSPFTKPSDISKVIEGVDGNHNSSFSAREWHGFLWNKSGEGINHNFREKRKRRQDLSTQLLETGAIYCIATEPFLMHKSRFISPINPVKLSHLSPEIDTEEDLKACQLLSPLFN